MNGNGTVLGGPLFVRKFVNGQAVDTELCDTSGVVQTALPDAPTGNVTIATAKTLTVTDADALLVGGKIVPQTFTVELQQAQYGNVAWVAPFACKIVAEKERHTTAESTAATLTAMVKKVPSGTAIASGSDTTTAGINQKATANTVVTPTLNGTAGNYTLAAGDGLGVVLSASATELAGGTITVQLQRV